MYKQPFVQSSKVEFSTGTNIINKLCYNNISPVYSILLRTLENQFIQYRRHNA